MKIKLIKIFFCILVFLPAERLLAQAKNNDTKMPLSTSKKMVTSTVPSYTKEIPADSSKKQSSNEKCLKRMPSQKPILNKGNAVVPNTKYSKRIPTQKSVEETPKSPPK
jgi:hypothetical protein